MALFPITVTTQLDLQNRTIIVTLTGADGTVVMTNSEQLPPGVSAAFMRESAGGIIRRTLKMACRKYCGQANLSLTLSERDLMQFGME